MSGFSSANEGLITIISTKKTIIKTKTKVSEKCVENKAECTHTHTNVY